MSHNQSANSRRLWLLLGLRHERQFWRGCAKGAEKASCGERVVQKGVLESPFLLFPLKVFRANLAGAQKKRTLQKHPFGRPFPRTTPSPLLWRALNFGWGTEEQIGGNFDTPWAALESLCKMAFHKGKRKTWARCRKPPLLRCPSAKIEK